MQEKTWPFHAKDEIEAVKNVLLSGHTNYWTGSECVLFEKEFADFIGTKYAVAVMNGTVALEAALYALDIGPGDEVITSCRTFIASASSIVTREAIPVLADVDRESQNITVDTIKPLITSRTKAIIVVHLAGWPADINGILKLANQYGLKVIEDCAQAHGAMIDRKKVGSWGHAAAFSFCQDKIMTTGGEGGMITTDDEHLYRKMWSYKDHGKNYDKVHHQQHPPGFRWLHDTFGTNWRMTEMQAAIGRVQLKKLPEWLTQRKRNANILTNALSPLELLRVTTPASHIEHAYYKYYVFVRTNKLKSGWNRDIILQAINVLGISCYVGSCSEIYNEVAFQNARFTTHEVRPTAKELGETSLMFLVHPTLTEEDMQLTANKIFHVFLAATDDIASRNSEYGADVFLET